MKEVQAKHRKEQRELQSRITQKKKNATKKTRKGVNDECEALERELKERQRAELLPPADEDVANEPETPHLNSEDELNTSPRRDPNPNHSPTPKKRNRQKDRQARRAADQEAAIAAASAEAATMPDARSLELASMATHREALQLEETAIQPDGHCLYSAVAACLPPQTVRESGPYSLGYRNVRFAAAGFIEAHAGDFEAFLEEDVGGYVARVRDTAEWGGAVELQALARAYGRRINVLQGDGRVEKIGEGEVEEIWLAYYRHSFGLGEHYNTLKKRDSTASGTNT